jgi:hypothetical protein
MPRPLYLSETLVPIRQESVWACWTPWGRENILPLSAKKSRFLGLLALSVVFTDSAVSSPRPSLSTDGTEVRVGPAAGS